MKTRKDVYDTDTLTDLSTGEVFQVRTKTRIVKNIEAFRKVYIDDICTLSRCTDVEKSVVLCCLKYLEYNTNQFFLNVLRKKEITECCERELSSVNNAITRLIKKGIFIRTHNLIYLLNPGMFFFGTDESREETKGIFIKYKFEK